MKIMSRELLELLNKNQVPYEYLKTPCNELIWVYEFPVDEFNNLQKRYSTLCVISILGNNNYLVSYERDIYTYEYKKQKKYNDYKQLFKERIEGQYMTQKMCDEYDKKGLHKIQELR